jgi:hypothetical protein
MQKHDAIKLDGEYMAAMALVETQRLVLNENALRELEEGIRCGHHYSPRLSGATRSTIYNDFQMQVDFQIPAQGPLAEQLGIATRESSKVGISAHLVYSFYRGVQSVRDYQQTVSVTLLRDPNTVLGSIYGETDHDNPKRSVRIGLVEAANDAYMAVRKLMAAHLEGEKLTTLRLPTASLTAKLILRCPGLKNLFVQRDVFSLEKPDRP